VDFAGSSERNAQQFRAFVLFKLHNLYDGSPQPSNSVIRCSPASESRRTNSFKLKNEKACLVVRHVDSIDNVVGDAHDLRASMFLQQGVEGRGRAFQDLDQIVAAQIAMIRCILDELLDSAENRGRGVGHDAASSFALMDSMNRCPKI